MNRSNFDSRMQRRNANNRFSSSITVKEYLDIVDFFSRSAFHALMSVLPACDLNALFANVVNDASVS